MGGGVRGRKTTRGTATRTRVAPRPSTHWKRASFIRRPSSERCGPGGHSSLRYPHIRLYGLWRKGFCEATHKCHIGLVTAVTGGERTGHPAGGGGYSWPPGADGADSSDRGT